MSISNSQLMYPYAQTAYSPSIIGGPTSSYAPSPLGAMGQMDQFSSPYGAQSPLALSGTLGVGGSSSVMQLVMSIMQMMMSLLTQMFGGQGGGLGSLPTNTGSTGSAGTSGNSGTSGNAGSSGNAGNAGNADSSAGNAGDAASPSYGPTPTPTGGGYPTPTGSGSPTPTGGGYPTPTGSGAPISGGKEGLGVSNTSSNGDGSNLGSTKASWYYNWSPNASSQAGNSNAQFIPMIWGQKNMNPQDLQAAANSNAPMLLTFNEPEQGGQANMTPQQALDDWGQLEATGKKLSSPAITNDGDGSGIQWLDQFMSGAKAGGHRVDSIALHWYGSTSKSTADNLSDMKNFINQVHSKYPNMPIDLTEFGVDPNGLTAGKDQDFLNQAEQMLNGMPYVQMYSPYGLGTINGNQ